MTKKEFMDVCREAIKDRTGIMVYVDMPGNKAKERIINSSVDVENKMEYYDKTYDETMKHKHAPITIVYIEKYM